jgi:hypothetical protein
MVVRLSDYILLPKTTERITDIVSLQLQLSTECKPEGV